MTQLDYDPAEGGVTARTYLSTDLLTIVPTAAPAAAPTGPPITAPVIAPVEARCSTLWPQAARVRAMPAMARTLRVFRMT